MFKPDRPLAHSKPELQLKWNKTSESETLPKAQTALGQQKMCSVERGYLSKYGTEILWKNCFPTQNFTEIEQSAAELRAINDVSRPPS